MTRQGSAAGPPGARSDSSARSSVRAARGTLLLRHALSASAAVLLVVLAGRLLRATPSIGALDRQLVVAANGALGPTTRTLAHVLDLAFAPPGAALLLLLAAALLAVRRRSTLEGLRLGLLVVLPWGTLALVKLVVRRPRPAEELLVHQVLPSPDSFSFPSGHTAVAAALCCAAATVLLQRRGRRPGETGARGPGAVLGPVLDLVLGAVLPVVVAAAIIALTAWSRVALGVHHPTDVLASAVLAPVLVVLLARMLEVALPVPAPAAGAAPGAGTSEAVPEATTETAAGAGTVSSP